MKRRWRALLAAITTWSVAVIAYYFYLVVMIVFNGQPGRPEMHISKRASGQYWENVRAVRQYDVLGGIGEWILVAVGGLIVGFLTALIYLAIQRRRKNANWGIGSPFGVWGTRLA